MAIAVAILNRLFVVAIKSYLYALLYLVYTIRLFENNLGYFLHKLRIFFLNFIRNQNGKSDNFPRNPINAFLADLRFFFRTGKENLDKELLFLIYFMACTRRSCCSSRISSTEWSKSLQWWRSSLFHLHQSTALLLQLQRRSWIQEALVSINLINSALSN